MLRLIIEVIIKMLAGFLIELARIEHKVKKKKSDIDESAGRLEEVRKNDTLSKKEKNRQLIDAARSLARK